MKFAPKVIFIVCIALGTSGGPQLAHSASSDAPFCVGNFKMAHDDGRIETKQIEVECNQTAKAKCGCSVGAKSEIQSTMHKKSLPFCKVFCGPRTDADQSELCEPRGQWSVQSCKVIRKPSAKRNGVKVQSDTQARRAK